MASLIRYLGYLLHLDEPDFVEILIRYFAAHVRTKKFKCNKEYGGEN